MKKVTLTTLASMKKQSNKITVLTCYDSTFAKIANQAGIDVLLIGDTLGMVLQGHKSTLPVTMEHMIYHTTCVAKGNEHAFLISDMPFMSYNSPEDALRNAGLLIKAGAHMVKVEGDLWLSDSIKQLTQYGIPVCAHIGLTPQAVHVLGGFKVQGKSEEQAEKLLSAAISLEKAGAAMLLIECVPATLAERITQSVNIPVIGIGAGVNTDAQVLVLYDMLGLNDSPAKFVHNFMENALSIKGAIENYIKAVKEKKFPEKQHEY